VGDEGDWVVRVGGELVVVDDERLDLAVLRGIEAVDVAAEELVKTRLMLLMGLKEMGVEAVAGVFAL
jgi:hypothetical protein